MNQRAPAKHKLLPNACLLRIAMIVSCLLALSPPLGLTQSLGSQEKHSFLPSTTGDPLTVKPIDLPDVNCTVVTFDKTVPEPVLTLLCPPQSIFAPIRVYLKMSWKDSGNVPDVYQDVAVQNNTSTKLRTSKASALVWLKTKKSNEDFQYEWVPFNGVVDFALIVDPQNRRAH